VAGDKGECPEDLTIIRKKSVRGHRRQIPGAQHILLDHGQVDLVTMFANEGVDYIVVSGLIIIEAGGHDGKATFETLRTDATMPACHRQIAHTGTTGCLTYQIVTARIDDGAYHIRLRAPQIAVLNGD